MKPGRELDALIAEKVMGWKRIIDVEYALVGEGPNHEHVIPSYSTDIVAAWEVVEKYKDCGFELFYDYNNQYWVCGITGSNIEVLSSVSAPHAICLAALKAVGHKLEEQE